MNLFENALDLTKTCELYVNGISLLQVQYSFFFSYIVGLAVSSFRRFREDPV